MSVSLAADDVIRRYAGVKALDCVSVHFEAGRAAAIVGESGSGKTTLLRCFNRMVEPDAGDVRVGSDNVKSLDVISLRRRLGYVRSNMAVSFRTGRSRETSGWFCRL
jgi:ABC-type proline/glycine betaine transport system ATPase subunit